VELLAKILAVVCVLTMHEFCHAYAAYKCGDPTAKWHGRMTLNPAKHFDPVGIILFAFAGFGWAKPVPINPNNFKNYRWGSFWTSVAGVLCNFLFAFLCYPILVWANEWFIELELEQITYGHYFALFLPLFLYNFSLNFCAFNLLPIFPLDGFRIVDSFDTKRGKVYCFLRDYGQIILLGLIVLGLLSEFFVNFTGNYVFGYLDILGMVMGYFVNILSKPIVWIWGLIL
jgi:Zn-dependent protease